MFSSLHKHFQFNCLYLILNCYKYSFNFEKGTDAFQAYLKRHPQVMASFRQECHFFDLIYPRKELENKKIPQVRDRYFSHCFKGEKVRHSDKIYFEKTPLYILEPLVAQRIKRVVPWAKIVFLLRDPIERAYSAYKHGLEFHCKKRNCESELSNATDIFESCVDVDVNNLSKAGILDDDFLQLDDKEIESRWLKYWEMWTKNREDTNLTGILSICNDRSIGRRLYFIHLQQWLKLKSNDESSWGNNMLILKSENMKPDTETNKIDFKPFTNFIGIEDFEVISEKTIHATKYFGPMRGQVRRYLMNLLDPFNKKLASILGDKWKDPWPYDDNRNI